jgi:hypothetical protein
MGREIRRVPEGWEHPEDRYLYDGSLSAKTQRWVEEFDLWRQRQHPSQIRARERESEYYEEIYDHDRFWEYEHPPEVDDHRPDWEAQGIPVDHYQVYETVSEGSPVSPVFATLAEVENWLVEQGYSTGAAKGFIEAGSAPSMMVQYSPGTGVRMMDGIEFYGETRTS